MDLLANPIRKQLLHGDSPMSYNVSTAERDTSAAAGPLDSRLRISLPPSPSAAATGAALLHGRGDQRPQPIRQL
jgi:hypothetical protein